MPETYNYKKLEQPQEELFKCFIYNLEKCVSDIEKHVNGLLEARELFDAKEVVGSQELFDKISLETQDQLVQLANGITRKISSLHGEVEDDKDNVRFDQNLREVDAIQFFTEDYGKNVADKLRKH